MVETKTIRVALYARVSTTNHGQDVTLQTRELKEFVECPGWQLAGKYIDLGISGTKIHRPELDRYLANARRHQFWFVLVPEVFRPSLGDLLPTLPSKLDGGGIFFLRQNSVGLALISSPYYARTALGQAEKIYHPRGQLPASKPLFGARL